MTYSEARRYIESLKARGWRLGLDRMEVFLERLGNPHIGVKAFHVAGTNGKGSVTGMIAACIKAAGFRTGAFFSPYVYDFRERIQIDGEMISKADAARLTDLIKPIADEMAFEEVGGPTEFEFKTAMAFIYWKEMDCDFISVEVGLGGRLDATNVMENPLCAVITEIGLDHQQFLGDTIEEIAGEKAGIIKPGRPVVTGVTDDRAFEVIKQVAEDRGSPCLRVAASEGSHLLRAAVVPLLRWENEGGSVGPIRARPNFMGQNAAVAIAALKEGLPDHNWEEVASRVLPSFSMPGRMEIVRDAPRIILDGAHNEQAIRAVLSSIGGQIVSVYSCATGHRPLVHVLEEKCRDVFTAPMRHDRALPGSEWTTTHDSVKGALAAALATLQEGETLLVTGSFFLLGEAKAALSDLTSER